MVEGRRLMSNGWNSLSGRCSQTSYLITVKVDTPEQNRLSRGNSEISSLERGIRTRGFPVITPSNPMSTTNPDQQNSIFEVEFCPKPHCFKNCLMVRVMGQWLMVDGWANESVVDG